MNVHTHIATETIMCQGYFSSILHLSISLAVAEFFGMPPIFNEHYHCSKWVRVGRDISIKNNEKKNETKLLTTITKKNGKKNGRRSRRIHLT